MISRRTFAKGLGASALLLPFLPRPAWAAGGPARRVIIISSIGTNNALWTPASPAGQAVALPDMLKPLQPVLGDIVLADGLSFAQPTEGHSSPQTLTGLGFDDAFGPECNSVDQFIAAKLAAPTELPKLLLGWQAQNESQFWFAGSRVPTLDSPVNAWQTAFAGAPVKGATRAAPALPRQSILDLVKRDIRELQSQLGSEANKRLNDHMDSISQLERGATGGVANCAAPSQPDLQGMDPLADAATIPVANAHVNVMVAALQCDVTRVVGMQFGISDRQYFGVPNCNFDEHSMVHDGDMGTPGIIAAENYMCTWFVSLIDALKKAPDPLNAGSSLFDNTLILWTRDQGDAPDHKQYSMPYVLAGAKGYLKTSPGGAYVNYGGNDKAGVSGVEHQRLLLNLCDYMGVSNFTDFGTVKALAPGAQQPLAEIKM